MGNEFESFSLQQIEEYDKAIQNVKIMDNEDVKIYYTVTEKILQQYASICGRQLAVNLKVINDLFLFKASYFVVSLSFMLSIYLYNKVPYNFILGIIVGSIIFFPVGLAYWIERETKKEK